VSVTPDGSPVDLYLLFPPAGEAERVHAAIPEGATVLDLGCGVGRIAHELVRLGHPVVAVDESREMLAHVRDAEPVQAQIESLDLERRFPCVLLASHLVNTADATLRRGFLAACARHVADDGVVLIERHEPGWTPEEGVRGQMGDITIALEDVRTEPPSVAATVRYESGGRTWRHPFDARLLDDAAMDEELRAVGLELTGVLDERGTWVEARLYSGA
jgi:SAM-dependent methyltransferase